MFARVWTEGMADHPEDRLCCPGAQRAVAEGVLTCLLPRVSRHLPGHLREPEQ